MLCFLSGCEEEPLPVGIETRIFGAVLDTINQVPIPNVQVKISEYLRQGTFSGTNRNFKGYLDSTLTKANGTYYIIFETSGKGTVYGIQIPLIENIHFESIQNFISEENIGGLEELNFYGTILYPVNLRIITNDAFEENILVYAQYSGDIMAHGSGQNSSERILYLDKNHDNAITFNLNNTIPLLRVVKLVPPTNSELLTTVEIELFQSDFK